MQRKYIVRSLYPGTFKRIADGTGGGGAGLNSMNHKHSIVAASRSCFVCQNNFAAIHPLINNAIE
jgi:hypothetical protein